MTTRHDNRPTHGAKREATDDRLSERILIREARKVVIDLRLPICGSRIKRLVRRYLNEGRSDVDFRTWFIAYADPTGETAVRNVIREQHAQRRS